MQISSILSKMLGLLFVSQLYAMPVYQTEQEKASVFAASIYHNELQHSVLSMPEKLEKISRLFLGRPYLLGALGEGRSGQYDQYPLYRFDKFDCLTFVETVLALSLAHDVHSFQSMMQHIRYQDGQISFLKRNHFTDLDWNTSNQRQGYLKDMTLSIKNGARQPVAKIAHAKIDKPNWYRHMSVSHIRLEHDSVKKQHRQLSRLKAEGEQLPIQEASIPYIPLTAIFDEKLHVNQAILKQIPDGSIVEIVRPDWDLRSAIGTALNVSHLGFAFWRNGTLFFRNASTLKGFVVDQPLIPYLREALKSPTIKGINVQVVRFSN